MAGSRFHDGGCQLPLAEIAGVSDDLKRLSDSRGRERTQNDRQKECSHDMLRVIAACLSAPRQKRVRVGYLGPGIIRGIGDRDDLAVILMSLGGLTGFFGGLRRADIGA